MDTDGKKALAIQKLLVDNENDMLSVDSRYKCLATRLRVKQDLRLEKEELLHQLGRLTGHAAQGVSVDDIAAPISEKYDGDSGGESDKEPVKV